MVRLAVEPYDFLEFSDFEQCRDGFIYTADTLTLLKQKFPENHYYFIVGGDSINSIEKWYHPEVVLSNCTLLAAGRNEIDWDRLKECIDKINKKYNADVRPVRLKSMDISSTEVRNGDLEDVPEAVMNYIIENNLY